MPLGQCSQGELLCLHVLHLKAFAEGSCPAVVICKCTNLAQRICTSHLLGVLSAVGMGSALSGGGLAFASKACGLTTASIVAAELVTASSDMVSPCAAHKPCIQYPFSPQNSLRQTC